MIQLLIPHFLLIYGSPRAFLTYMIFVQDISIHPSADLAAWEMQALKKFLSSRRTRYWSVEGGGSDNS